MNIAVILSAGSGVRIGGNTPKQYIEILGKPIIAYTLELFEKNKNIDFIQVVANKNDFEKIKNICNKYNISKFKWLCAGGNNFQNSVKNSIFDLKNKIKDDDIVIISFGVAPLTPQDDINDAIFVAEKYGNAISAKDIDLCTCIKDDEISSSTSILRENLKGFANPWAFKYNELFLAYEYAIKNNILDDIEPHTTSLYFKLGKKIYFSQCTSPQVKITYKSDLELFEAFVNFKKDINVKP